MISDDLIQTFQEELGDLLESLDRCLLDLKARPDDESLVAQVFRDLHTIKGNGGMFGFAALSAFVHTFESAFDRIRSGDAAVTPEVIRLALMARDEIPQLVEGVPDPEGRRQALLDALEAELGFVPAGHVSAKEKDAQTEATPRGARVLRFRLLGPVFDTGLRPELILDELIELGATNLAADVSRLPNLAELDTAQSHIVWTCNVPPTVTEGVIEEVFVFADAEWDLSADADENQVVDVARPDEIKAAETSAEVVPTEQAAVSTTREVAVAAATVRVPAARLDALMDSVGELVIVEARLTELARQSRDPALLATAEQITRLASGLRDTTMTMRMVPMRTLVGRFRRLVSEAADSLGKPVRFVVEGEDTEFDKTLIEKLADPIVHLLRNAIDHGIELPGTRTGAGKTEEAVISLTAEQSGAEVLVKIKDDGRGMSAARIRAKAISNGLIGPEAQMTDAQLCNLIFEPGFSTATEVTEISGRGVGMDVVRRTIEGLRGSISLETKEGKGTTVTLKLPLTLAIIDGLLIDVQGERYTLPMESVQEIVELPEEIGKSRKSAEFLDIRGQFVPFMRLRTVLGCTGKAPDRQNVVVVNCGNEKAGLVVDHILGTNQVVIKQMSKLHRGVNTVSGASILGDGSVALILDVPQLVNTARKRTGTAEGQAEVAA